MLESLQRSISHPFQQLPSVIAVFLAESGFVLVFPGAAMYSPINKLLLKRPQISLKVSLL